MKRILRVICEVNRQVELYIGHEYCSGALIIRN